MSLSRGRHPEPMPRVEINIVPLVDISLVLLIIFMVTTTFMKSAGMHIQLPSSSVTKVTEAPVEDLVIGIDRRGTYYWESTPVSDTALQALLAREAADHGTQARVIVQGDARCAHGRVVTVMTLAQQAGFQKLVVATLQAGGGTGGR
jgi:biopolymer transport protein ExbD